ncbi:hypothetical protein OU415_05155 [Saccharopolyspora sp. WRP15-2]|uniref:Uncharacterized protein n=1 Tax=Saccharopolyspora oryzae TaxID=2997343 RepID=A0ABT4USX5_9PSEU|nr:hypothetical protein [Saccharopolyspora oryzae]MDA3624817.1 hypothetical protein [Saccharopolyspora oryzae]
MANVLAGIIGALLGFSGALLGAWIKSRAEHGKWLRDQKLAGAAEMVSAGTSIFELRIGSPAWIDAFEPSELREWQAQLQRGRAVIHTLCTEETRAHANAFVKSCWSVKSDDAEEKAISALQAFTASLRKEIGVD